MISAICRLVQVYVAVLRWFGLPWFGLPCPGTGAPIDGLQIPDWPRLVLAASNLANALELGYAGVDFVLDAARGPVVLEANARPGLAIQLANRCGLLSRLRRIDQLLPDTALKPEQRVELAAAISS